MAMHYIEVEDAVDQLLSIKFEEDRPYVFKLVVEGEKLLISGISPSHDDTSHRCVFVIASRPIDEMHNEVIGDIAMSLMNHSTSDVKWHRAKRHTWEKNDFSKLLDAYHPYIKPEYVLGCIEFREAVAPRYADAASVPEADLRRDFDEHKHNLIIGRGGDSEAISKGLK